MYICQRINTNVCIRQHDTHIYIIYTHSQNLRLQWRTVSIDICQVAYIVLLWFIYVSIYIYTHMNTSLLSHVVSFTGLFWKSHTLPKLTTAMTDSEQVGYTGRLWFIYVSIDICKHVSFVTCRLFTGLFCKSLVIYTHLFRYLIGKSVSFPLSPCK